jgi:hypothetical protein
MPKKPCLPAVYSAANTAPKAKPLRVLASWVMVMLSASES